MSPGDTEITFQGKIASDNRPLAPAPASRLSVLLLPSSSSAPVKPMESLLVPGLASHCPDHARMTCSLFPAGSSPERSPVPSPPGSPRTQESCGIAPLTPSQSPVSPDQGLGLWEAWVAWRAMEPGRALAGPGLGRRKGQGHTIMPPVPAHSSHTRPGGLALSGLGLLSR